jgi:hypothetical protein
LERFALERFALERFALERFALERFALERFALGRESMFIDISTFANNQRALARSKGRSPFQRR